MGSRRGGGSGAGGAAGEEVDLTRIFAHSAQGDAAKALSGRLQAFRTWLKQDAGVVIHPAVCIVNGEATDGTKNAPVLALAVDPLAAQQAAAIAASTTLGSSSSGAGAASNAGAGNGESSGAGYATSGNSGSTSQSPQQQQHQYLAGRLGIVDGDADQALYERTMGCQVRAAREIKKDEVIWTMPRGAMVTPDLVASSDAGRAIVACCCSNSPQDGGGGGAGSDAEEMGNGSATAESTQQSSFWDVFENTTIAQNKLSPKVSRTTGPKLLIKILQERKRAESAFAKYMQQWQQRSTEASSSTMDNSSSSTSNKSYTLVEHKTLSTRAPVLAFLIHQRFSNEARPAVVSESESAVSQFRALLESEPNLSHALKNTARIVKPPSSPYTFAPYARTLPSSIALPLCWKRNELALLAECIPGIGLLQEVAVHTMLLANEFIALLEAGLLERFPNTFPAGLITWERWVWAAACSASRILPASSYLDKGVDAFNFQPENKEVYQSPPDIWNELGVMVPLLDMLNHEFDAHQVTWQPCVPEKAISKSENGETSDKDGNDDTDKMQTEDGDDKKEESKEEPHPPRAVVHKKVRKGSELYCCYGNLSNHNMILQYGFAQIVNPSDEVRLGWGLTDAVGGKAVAHKQHDGNCTSFGGIAVVESTDPDAVNAWWTEDRLALLEREAFSAAEESFMDNLKAGKKMTAAAHADGSYHPILLTAAVISTMTMKQVRKYAANATSTSEEKIVITKSHLNALRSYLVFSFTRKLEKLLQNLDKGLKSHFGGNLKLWTKATNGGLGYKEEEGDDAKGNGDSHHQMQERFTGWHTFFDANAYISAMEVEKRYYSMGSTSCVLTLYDGQLRALQESLDGLTDDEKFQKQILKQLRELGFEISENEGDLEEDDTEDEAVDNKTMKEEEEAEQQDAVPVPLVKVEAHVLTADTKKEGSTEDTSETPSQGGEDKKDSSSAKGSGDGKRGSRNRKRRKKNQTTLTNQIPGERPPAMKLHVGNLSYATTPSDLYDFFSAIYGKDNILECHIPIERDSGRSRGFGFVTMPEGVAIKALNSNQKHEMAGRLLKVAKSNSAGTGSAAKPPPTAPTPPHTDRCANCGYRPKYCACPVPNLPGMDYGRPHPPPPPHGMHPMDMARYYGPYGPGPPPLPPPLGPPYLGPPGPDARFPPNDRYRDPSPFYADRFVDDSVRYGRDFDRDRWAHRYDEGRSRSFDRGDDRHRERDSSRTRRDRDSDRPHDLDRGHSRDRSGSRGSSRRWDHDERSRGQKREGRAVDNGGAWDERRRSRSRSRDRSLSRSRSRDRSRKKKSKRRHHRSPSRSISPAK